MLKTTPDDVVQNVIKNFMKLVEVIDLQGKTLSSVQKDFTELYVMMVQIIRQFGGAEKTIKINSKDMNADILSFYRIVKTFDKKTKEIILNVMYITDEGGKNYDI